MTRPDDTDEALLTALGDVARSEGADGLDARWDALAAGTLSAADRAALEALAAREPDGDAIWAAFAPRDAAVDDAIAASILAETRSAQPESTQRESTPPNPTQPESAAAPVIDLAAARARRKAWAWIGAGLAVAAGLLLFALRPGPALPTYALESRAGEQVLRGDAHAARAVYGPGSQIDLIVRPPVDLSEPVNARVFHVAGETRTLLTITPTISPTGVVRIRGLVDDLLPATPGPQTLIIAVGRPGAVPKSVDALNDGLLNGPNEWQTLRHEYQRR